MHIPIEDYTIVTKARFTDPVVFGGDLPIPPHTYRTDEYWCAQFTTKRKALQFAKKLKRYDITIANKPSAHGVLAHPTDKTCMPLDKWIAATGRDPALMAWEVGTIPAVLTSRKQLYDAITSALPDLQEVQSNSSTTPCRTTDAEAPELAKQSTTSQWQHRFHTAATRIAEMWSEHHQLEPNSQDAQNITQAIRSLQHIAQQCPGLWQIPFVINKGYQLLGRKQEAYDLLEAFSQQHKICRLFLFELHGLCLHLGRFHDAEMLSTSSILEDPKCEIWLGQHALALLLNKRLLPASLIISLAYQLNLYCDQNYHIALLIKEVTIGARAQPEHLSDLGIAPVPLIP